ncbi:hypothetical protein [Aliiglaciecola litoralis]|uniref:Uncharacterized protein n=1 Tax=Aliiglaciecola litoralis TaxID=582857 RepID=A0ABP3X885_9ALTE
MNKFTFLLFLIAFAGAIFFGNKAYRLEERLELATYLFQDAQNGHILSEQIWVRTLIDIEKLRRTDPIEAGEVAQMIICEYPKSIEDYKDIQTISKTAIESLKLTKSEVELYCGN